MSRKKKILIVAGLGLFAVTWAFGGDILGLYRFTKAVKPYEDIANVRGHHELTDTCVNCHGFNGNSQSSEYPYLAGLSEQYLAKTLVDFQNGNRKNPMMSPFAKQLSKDEISQLSKYFAGQTHVNRFASKQTPQPFDEDAQVLLEECMACHGADFKGGKDLIGPRIAGQGEKYLNRQLLAYKSGERQEQSGLMNVLMKSKSENEIKAMSRFISAAN